MKIVQSISLRIFLVASLVLSVFVPSLTQAYTLLGNADNPQLTIHKFEQEPLGDEFGDQEPSEDEDLYARALPNNGAPGDGTADQYKPAGITPLEGVTFTLTKTHHYNAQTDTWTEVFGDDKVTIEATTNAEGKAIFTKENDLELGRYEVRETAGPDHVILNNEVFTVDIPMTNVEGDTLNYDVHIYPKNETIRGDIELIKKDENGNILKGIEFDLYHENGKKVKDSQGTEISPLFTNEYGKIGVTGLAAGKYYFQEKTTDKKLALNTSKLAFEIRKDASGQEIEVQWTPQDKYLTDNGEFTNYKKPEIKKDVEEQQHIQVDRDKAYTYNLTINTPKDIENYGLLAVTDTLDNRLEYAGSWDVVGTEKDNIQFTQEGQTLIWEVKDLSKLIPGEDIKISFTSKIKKDAVLKPEETGIPNTAKLDFDNDKGSYTKPKDPNNPPLTPPEEPPTTPPVTVDPTEGGLKVIKVDKKDPSIKLEGAEFKLTTDKEGKDVVVATGTVIEVNGNTHEGNLEKLVTGKDGEIAITGLTPGTYYLHETKAPTYTNENGEVKPYRLLAKPLEVEVENKVHDKAVTVENSKSGWDLPTTGGMGTMLFTVAGLGFMLLAFALYNRREEDPAV